MWRRWGTPQNFCLTFIAELQKKPDYLLKKVLKWVNKKYKILILTCSILKNKERKTLGDIIILRVWHTGIRNYGSFFILLHPIPKNPQNCWRYHHFTHVCQKPQSYGYGSWVTLCEREFFVILGHFFPFIPLTTHNIKILKKWKNHLEMSLFYTCVPKIMTISSMLFVLLPH